jgi:predicted peptidase
MVCRLLIALTLLNSNCYSQIVSKHKSSYNYLLYLPKDYSERNAEYPLLIYLHGGSQRGNDLNTLKTYGFSYLVEQGQDFNFIIASPLMSGREVLVNGRLVRGSLQEFVIKV